MEGTCDTLTCPNGYTLKPNSQEITCIGETCNIYGNSPDLENCCNSPTPSYNAIPGYTGSLCNESYNEHVFILNSVTFAECEEECNNNPDCIAFSRDTAWSPHDGLEHNILDELAPATCRGYSSIQEGPPHTTAMGTIGQDKTCFGRGDDTTTSTSVEETSTR